MGQKLRVLDALLFFLSFHVFWNAPSVNAQIFGCTGYHTLQMDSSLLHQISYPYIHSKRAFTNSSDPHILLYFQGFYESLLYDIDTLNFELFNAVAGSSTILRIAVNDVFIGHKDKPRYKLNDFSLHGNQLFLLVHNSVYVFDILENNVCVLNGKYSYETRGFQWMTVIQGEKVLLIDLVNSSGHVDEIVMCHANLIEGKIEISKTLQIPFNGKSYLHTEATYISETANQLYIGNATSSRVNVFDKSSLEWKDSLNLGNAVGFKQIDSLKFLNKMQFFEAVRSDTNQYHYQSCYGSDNLILRARCKTPGKSVHYLDIHHYSEHGWDSLTTMVEGVYNSKREGAEGKIFTSMHFDPMSSTRSHILVGDRLYSPGFKYSLRRSEESNEFVTYFFSVNELISMGKELFKTKDFKFVLYQYEEF